MTLESKINEMIGSEIGQRLCQQLKRSEPKIYKDQLWLPVTCSSAMRRWIQS